MTTTITPYRKTKPTPLCHCGAAQVAHCNVCHRPQCQQHAAEACGYCDAEHQTDEENWGGLGGQLITIAAAVLAIGALVILVPQTYFAMGLTTSAKVFLGLSAAGVLAAGVWPAAVAIKRDLLNRRRQKAHLLRQHNIDHRSEHV